MAASDKKAAPATPTHGPAFRGESLGDSLRALFQHVVEQPLPGDLLDLVDELERGRALDTLDEA